MTDFCKSAEVPAVFLIPSFKGQNPTKKLSHPEHFQLIARKKLRYHVFEPFSRASPPHTQQLPS